MSKSARAISLEAIRCAKGSESGLRKVIPISWCTRVFPSAGSFGAIVLLVNLVALLLSGWGAADGRSSLHQDTVPRLVQAQKPTPPAAGRVITHGPRTAREIALTFDACSTRAPSHYDERVTQVLVETNTPATIFLGGKWIEEEEDHARYLASKTQFELGNHTYLHPHLTQIPENRIREELESTQRRIYKLTGKKANLFRPPYGEYDDRVLKIAAEAGLTTIEYDLPSGDPDIHVTKEKLVEYVTSMARNGSIVVMHINRRGWHTSEALPEIISNLRRRGFRLVTVGELLRAPGTTVKAGNGHSDDCFFPASDCSSSNEAMSARFLVSAFFPDRSWWQMVLEDERMFLLQRSAGNRLLSACSGVLHEHAGDKGRNSCDLVK